MDQGDSNSGDNASASKISASRLAQIAASLNGGIAPATPTEPTTVEPIRIENTHKASVTLLSPVTKSSEDVPVTQQPSEEEFKSNDSYKIVPDEAQNQVTQENRANHMEDTLQATEMADATPNPVAAETEQIVPEVPRSDSENPEVTQLGPTKDQGKIDEAQNTQLSEPAIDAPKVREGHSSEAFVSFGGEKPLLVQVSTIENESPTQVGDALSEPLKQNPSAADFSDNLAPLEQAPMQSNDKAETDPLEVYTNITEEVTVSKVVSEEDIPNSIRLHEAPVNVVQPIEELPPVVTEESSASVMIAEPDVSTTKIKLPVLEEAFRIEATSAEIRVNPDPEDKPGDNITSKVEVGLQNRSELVVKTDIEAEPIPAIVGEPSKSALDSDGPKLVASVGNFEKISLPSSSSQGESPSEAVDLTPASLGVDQQSAPEIQTVTDQNLAIEEPARHPDRVEDFTVATPEREYGSEITDRLPTEMVGEQMPWLPGQPLSIHHSHQASTQIAYGLSSQTTVMPQRFEDIVQLSSPESHRTDRPMLLQMKKGEGPFSRSRASSPGDAGPAQSVIPSQERCEEMGPRAWQSETGSENNDHRGPRHQKSLLIIQEAPERSSARQSLALSHTSMDPLNPVPPVAPIKPNAYLCDGMAVSSLSGTKSQSVSVAEVEMKPKTSPTKGPNPKDTYTTRSKLKKASDNAEPTYENVSSSSEAGNKKPRDRESTQQNQGPIEVEGVRLPDTATELSSSSVVTIPGKPSSDLMVNLKLSDSKLPKGSTTSAGEQKDGHKKSGKRKKPVSSVNDPNDANGNPRDGRNGEEAESLDLNRKFSKLSAKVRNLKKELKEAKETLAGYEMVDPEQEAYERRKRLEKEDQERGNRKLSVLQIIKDMGVGEDQAEAAEKTARKSDRPQFQSGSSSTAHRAHVIADHTVPPAEVHRGGWTSRDRQDESKNTKKAFNAKVENMKIAETVQEAQPAVSRPALKTEQNLKNLQNSHSKKMFKDEDEEDSVKKLGKPPQGRLSRLEPNHSPISKDKHSSKATSGHGSERHKKAPEDLKKLHASTKDESRLIKPSITLQDSSSLEKEDRPRARRNGKPSPPQPKLVKEPHNSKLEDEEVVLHGSHSGRGVLVKESRKPEELLGKREIVRKRRGQSADSSGSSDTQEKIKHTLRRYETNTKHRS